MPDTSSSDQNRIDGFDAAQDSPTFLKDFLLLDLEAGKNRIYGIGAVLDGKVFARQGRFDVNEALSALDSFAENAQGVLGHNILEHDLPILENLQPRLTLLGKPVIDTLFLSPLAFPENPYHRLVKDYKLVKDSVSDPVADARLAASVFLDQWESFSKMVSDGHADILSFYRFCFDIPDGPGGVSYQGNSLGFRHSRCNARQC